MPTETPKSRQPRAKRRNFALEIESLKTYVATKLEVLKELEPAEEPRIGAAAAEINNFSKGQINALQGVLKKMESAR